MTRRGRRGVDLLPLKVEGTHRFVLFFFPSPSPSNDGFRSSNDAEKSFELQLPREGKDSGAKLKGM